MIPANDMLLFIDIVNLQSFSKAADRHRITPASVSKRVSSLEEVLSVKLINRSTRKLSLTEAGEVLYKYCSKLYIDLEEAYSAVLDAHKEPQGYLTIYCTTNFSNLILSSMLPEFLEAYKGIEVRIVIDDSNLVPDLGDYDIAIRVGKLMDSNVIARKLTTVRMVICASPTYIAKYGQPESLEDLRKHNCIDYDYRLNTLGIWPLKKGKEILETRIKGNLTTNNALFVKYVIMHGLGIAWLPDFMVKNEFKEGTLVPCLTEYNSADLDVHILHPYSNKHIPRKVKVFTDFLFQKMNPS